MRILRFINRWQETAYCWLVVCMMSCCEVSDASTVVVELIATKDNTLFEDAGGALSNGAGDYFFAGRSNQPPLQPGGQRGLIRRGLLAFDVAGSVPADAEILSAELRLFVSNVSLQANDPDEINVPISLHRNLADWGEGASDAVQQEGAGAIAGAGDATWLHRFSNTELWSQAGGDFLADASATTTVMGIGLYTWTDPKLTNDVRFFFNNPRSNFGWLLSGGENTPLTAKRFNSRTNPLAATRPLLTIEYTLVPEASTSVMLTFFAMCFCWRRFR